MRVAAHLGFARLMQGLDEHGHHALGAKKIKEGRIVLISPDHQLGDLANALCNLCNGLLIIKNHGVVQTKIKSPGWSSTC